MRRLQELLDLRGGGVVFFGVVERLNRSVMVVGVEVALSLGNERRERVGI